MKERKKRKEEIRKERKKRKRKNERKKERKTRAKKTIFHNIQQNMKLQLENLPSILTYGISTMLYIFHALKKHL